MWKHALHPRTVDPGRSSAQNGEQRPRHPLPAQKTTVASLRASTLPSALLFALKYVVKLLLPPACLLCGCSLNTLQRHPYLCPECARACAKQPDAACLICAEPFQSRSAIPHRCGQCTTSPPPFIWLKTIGLHAEQLQYAVQRLKYAGQFQLAEVLALLLLDRLRTEIISFNPHTIIPVPLHPRRLRTRGFNQSLLVARYVGAELDIPVDISHLIRTRPTSSQTKLNLAQRHENIHGAFSINTSLAPRRILLVDDVVTTSATCRECAKILTRAGHQVAAVALSRASLQRLC